MRATLLLVAGGVGTGVFGALLGFLGTGDARAAAVAAGLSSVVPAPSGVATGTR